MPAKFRIKDYKAGGIYHIYNKGIDGREVFLDKSDFEKFEEIMGKYLGEYVIKSDIRFKGERPYRVRHKQDMNLKGEVELWAYCLMPNHFHLLVKQNTDNGIVKLMRRVMTWYVMYFNQKYKRSGTLFAGVYKAVKITEGIDAVKLSRYIHLNPGHASVKRFGLVATNTSNKPEEYMYSSYQCYLRKREILWVEMSSIINTCPSEYSNYVNNPKMLVDEGIEGFTLE